MKTETRLYIYWLLALMICLIVQSLLGNFGIICAIFSSACFIANIIKLYTNRNGSK